MNRVAAVILAGGAARRLDGARKAEVIVGGKRLIDRVATGLHMCSPLLVSVGPRGAQIPEGFAKAQAVHDSSEEHEGPLAGLAAAAAFLGAQTTPPELLVSVAVDTPFLPRDYVARMVAGLGDASAAVAKADGQDYPTNAIWRLAALRELLNALGKDSKLGPRAIATRLGARAVTFDAGTRGNPFANVNTPADLAALELRADNFPEE
ncbi:molybdenum cofactor guanylyltransferase [Devosia sp.]|uniref:molybdenum cofactor guanylyltransferase n=1 Tax=Devosia sp. TaxID=1871048 RepID=UPI003A8E329A